MASNQECHCEFDTPNYTDNGMWQAHQPVFE